jgi:outer membrane protein OmpA-like peptidoglycan-associated protein
MNAPRHVENSRNTLVAAAVASLLLAACAAAPVKPEGAIEARAKLTALQSDPDLGARAPVAMKQAELAVRAAEVAEPDMELAHYRVYIADRKVDIAAALARTSLAEDQRVGLTQQRDKARLDSRTREADIATGRLASARVDLANQKSSADAARTEADAARIEADNAAGRLATARVDLANQKSDADAARAEADNAANRLANARVDLANQKSDTDAARAEAGNARMSAADAAKQSAELQRQLNELHAKQTDRGMVLTLGDVLFSSGMADLKVGATSNLNKLVAFLNHYPDRTVIIEGYTDNIGGTDYNLGLSQRRADSVKSYLAEQGIGARRLTASGKGLSDPVAGNDSAAGRQQNRRVEVIIATPPLVSR